MVQPVLYAIEAWLAIWNNLPVPFHGIFGVSLFLMAVQVLYRLVKE